MSHEKLIGMDQLDGWLLKPKVTPSLIFILKGDRIMNGSAVLKKVGMTVEKNLPTILSFVASAGVVGTAVLVGKETLKASQLLDQAKNIALLFNECKCDVGVGDLGYGAIQVQQIQDGGSDRVTGQHFNGVGSENFFGCLRIVTGKQILKIGRAHV